MSARDDILTGLRQSDDSTVGDLTPEQLVDAHRAEVLGEVTAWLIKKAREFHASRYKREREQGDTAAVLASKVARGAVRPNNLRMLPSAGFFEVDRTYQRRRWQFQCMAVAPNPFNGEIRAVGFLYRPGEPATATALDPDDWAHGEWIAATEGGAS